MMKRKKFVYALIGTMVISSWIPTYATVNEADNSTVVSESEQDIISFSLEDALKYALKNSKDIIIQEIELQKAKVVYEDNIRGVKEAEKNVDNMPTRDELGMAIPDATVNQGLISTGVSRRAVELPHSMAKWNLAKTKNQVKYNIEKAYFDLLQMGKEFEIATENFNLSKKQYQQGKVKYDLGIISGQQLLGLEMGLLQAQNGYDSTKMYYDLQVMSFQNTLGLPFNQKFKLTDTISYKKYEEIDLSSSIKQALENNIGLKTAKENYEISELTLKAIKGRYPENTYRYREQEAEVAKAAKNYETAKNGVEMSVRSAYLNLLTAEKQIITYEKTIEQAEKALKLAELNFDLGQNTTIDITQANINLMNAKKSLSGQIHAFNMALLDYEYSIGLGK